MNLLTPFAVALGLLCAVMPCAHGQVILRLNALHFNAYQPINVSIVNQESRTISVCVSEQWSPKPNDDVGVAHTPFLLQGHAGGKWINVLNGVDVGPPLRYRLTIESHMSHEFQFQTKGNGKARVVLYYWIGDVNACDRPRGRKRSVSPTFTVAEPEQH